MGHVAHVSKLTQFVKQLLACLGLLFVGHTLWGCMWSRLPLLSNLSEKLSWDLESEFGGLLCHKSVLFSRNEAAHFLNKGHVNAVARVAHSIK